MKSGKITSVFDIPQIQQEDMDYRKLYQKEKKMRLFYQRKTQELEKKMTVQFKDYQFTSSNHKAQHAQQMMEGIKSFKSNLPYSVKMIPNDGTNLSIDDGAAPPLIQQWAIFGLKESQLISENQNHKLEPSILACNPQPSQILEHTARLVFPSGIGTQNLKAKSALQTGLDIINLSKEKLKTFILTFEPTSISASSQNKSQSAQKGLEIINYLNPQRRIYAICLQLNDFTVLEQDDKMIEMKTTRKTQKSVKSVKFQSLVSTRQTNQLTSVVSKRVYTIFSYYPFFAFFEEMLKSVLFAVKVERYIKYKEGGENLRKVDSRLHCTLIKKAMKDLKDQSAGKAIVTDKLLDFAVCGNNKSYLQLSREAITYSMAEEWAYYVFSLFTLDIFLDVLTLMTLQEKVVFVCTNATILTHAIYLFTKVLIKPFEYPYPVVNLIPDQEQYLNAPFPVVYGYLKSREDIIEAKLHKKYKNVYVFFEPEGVQIVCEDDKKKILNKKSPKLRDRLISKFKKMKKNYPSTIFNFIMKKNQEFQFPVNIELSRQVIAEVCNYMQKDIYNNLPDEQTVEAIKKELMSTQEIDEDDINRETYLRIKEEYGPKSKDPFFAAFLETQLLNVFIFKY